MDFSNFKFRCSSLGYIMSEAKGKSNLEKYNDAKASLETKMKAYREFEATDRTHLKTAETVLNAIKKIRAKIEVLEPIKDVPHLSETCKTHLADVYTAVVYGRREDIKSRYMEKGLELEEDAITAYSLLTGEMHRKNKERRFNDFIEGEMDFEDPVYAIDTKVNWSIFQYNRVASRPILPKYHWQLDGYMWLWDKEKGKLVYVLLNTPEHLLAIEEKMLLRDFFGTKEDFEEACKELKRNHTYDDIELKDKVRAFFVNRDPERIEKLKRRILECRDYLNNFSKPKIYEDDETED